MPFVLDASIAGCWAFGDEGHAVADFALVRIRTEEAIVPSLWWFEVRNILIINERRGRISEADTSVFLRELSRLRITIDGSFEEAPVMTLARKHTLTVYDASYLELAQRMSFPLASLDKSLIRAARVENIKLLEDAA